MQIETPISSTAPSSVMRKTIVIKLGTSVLTAGTKKLNRERIIDIVRQCKQLRSAGHRIVIVTSGAIAAGKEYLSYPDLPATTSTKQLLAAVGQSRLIQLWEQLFAIYELQIGQMLLTRADIEDQERFLNARDTLNALLDNGIIPIVNENDAVATAEIKVGDNDNLSALVSILASADQLFLLTDQLGLFTADPRINPDATLIKIVDKITDDIRLLAGGTATGLGTGGMATKLQAAEVAMRAGVEVIIAAGGIENSILDIAEGKSIGTCFIPEVSPIESRKRWIFGAPVSGQIIIDEGAVCALKQKGSSLLPKGIIRVMGDFSRGEVVTICSLSNQTDSDAEIAPIARGVTRYNSDALRLIAGKHSSEIFKILSFEDGVVAIHRDEMIVTQ